MTMAEVAESIEALTEECEAGEEDACEELRELEDWLFDCFGDEEDEDTEDEEPDRCDDTDEEELYAELEALEAECDEGDDDACEDLRRLESWYAECFSDDEDE